MTSPRHLTYKKKKQHTTGTDWIVPLIKSIIAVKPRTSNQELSFMLCKYCQSYALTCSILQGVCNKVMLKIFGLPTINAQYIIALHDELELRGNHVKLMIISPTKAMKRMQLAIITKEVERWKAKGVHVLINDPSEEKLFLSLRMEKNKDYITEHFGSDDVNCQFIQGILFVPETAAHTVKYLQNLHQAGAADLQEIYFLLGL